MNEYEIGQEEANELPKIELAFNPINQSVLMRFENKHYKTWDMVLAVLGMATRQAEAQFRQQQMLTMIEAQQQAAQQQQLRRNLGL